MRPMRPTASLLACAAPVLGLSPRADVLKNPVLWQDLPDSDVFRVGDVFYYSTSTFAYSPGAPLYKSYDLASWTPVTHSVPTLDFGAKYSLDGGRAYVKGIWASSARYRASDDLFYWIGCIESGKTYVYTSPGGGAANRSGEVAAWDWKRHAVLNKCYYDCGLLVDDDDTLFVAYGNRKISVSQLSKDGSKEVRSEQVYDSGGTHVEGSHMYKINGYYWIVPTKVASGEWALRSKSPWGPYEQKVLFDNLQGPLSNAGYAHQGGMVDTKDGKWYYLAFMDAYPGGRIPVVAPVTWSADGWPQLVRDNGRWGSSYPLPVRTAKTVPPPTGTDNLTSIGHEWEWNHNPDASKFRAGPGGLVLQTATVTDDLFAARNTMTRRILGPKSRAVFELDVSQMKDGDRAGAAIFRDVTAYIGVHKTAAAANVVCVNGLNLTSSWATQSKGAVAASAPAAVTGSTVWLRITADVTPAFGLAPQRQAVFAYSLDGSEWKSLGPAFTMINDWRYFTGFRYAAFNFATKALGGAVTLKSFSMELV